MNAPTTAELPATASPATGHPGIEDEVRRLRALQAEDRHDAALEGANRALGAYPANRDLLLIAASALRHLRRTGEALAILERMAQHHAGYSLLLQEQGLCHVALRDAPQALAALNAAVKANPNLPMAWRLLGGLHRMTGNLAAAELAEGQCAHLASLPPPVVRAKSLFADGETDIAEAMIRDFLLRQGDHPEAMRLLAQIGFVRGVLDDAELLFAGALAMVPDHHDLRSEYVQTLIARHRYAAARTTLAPLLALDATNNAYRTQAATIAIGLGETEAAIAIYRAILSDIGGDVSGGDEDGDKAALMMRADVNLWLGHALKTAGQVPEAIEAYREAARIRPEFGDAWWSLANLKTYRFTDAEIATITAEEARPSTATIDRIHLAFALGKAHEDRKDHAASWAAYARGNAAKRADSGYHPEIFETNTREQKRVCTPAFFAAHEGWGCPDSDPIFVLGLPRSGSTLIEQILASHSQVEGTQELPDIQRIVHDLQGREHDFLKPRYPGNLPDLDRATVQRFGERYMADTRPYRTLGRVHFIDKMPNNFRHIGLIHLILPKATIIDARRNPMDCCFSNLKQLFAQGQEFTYSIDDIARYYRTYLELMRHWDEVLPGRVLRVVNEDLIEDPEGQIRRLLDHCGLPFEDSCLNFHQNRRSVRTPSSEQVRRPISRDGVDQWRPYAQWLGPLEEALGEALENWRT